MPVLRVSVVVLLCACSAVVPVAADGGTAASACLGVTCSGHGRCAVFEDGETTCVCEAGYSLRGSSECVTATNGCAGVTCNGHGTCELRGSDTPWCVCEAGYVAKVPEGTGSATQCLKQGCRRATDCANGTVCNSQTGECVAATGAVCGRPAATTGSATLNATCDTTNSLCGANLVCVPHTWVLPTGQTSYRPAQGRCLNACDPCAPSCATGQSCFRLESGGGFCTERLFGPGEAPGATGICSGVTGNRADCAPACVPEQVASHVAGATFPVSRSASCNASEVCSITLMSAGGSSWRCMPGTANAAGERCDIDGAKGCALPNYCWIFGSPTLTPKDGICAPVGQTCASCGAGTSCFTFPCAGGGDHCEAPVCVKDRSGKFGQLCNTDAHCEDWLKCVNTTCTPK